MRVSTKHRLIDALAGGPKTISQLVGLTELSRTTVFYGLRGIAEPVPDSWPTQWRLLLIGTQSDTPTSMTATPSNVTPIKGKRLLPGRDLTYIEIPLLAIESKAELSIAEQWELDKTRAIKDLEGITFNSHLGLKETALTLARQSSVLASYAHVLRELYDKPDWLDQLENHGIEK